MGSLSSRPKAPASTSPQVVFVPPATNTNVAEPSSTTATVSDSALSDDSNSSSSIAENRTESLLRRNRGRLGTVLTGLSGVLNPVRADGQKKTLLGE